jgi:predicted dehydrogenase
MLTISLRAQSRSEASTPARSWTMSTLPQSRREFLASITAAGAVSLLTPPSLDARTQRRSIGANDRIRIGVIGCGNRGIGTEMASVRDHAKEENLEVIAVYDPWRLAQEDAAAKAKEWFGTDARQCRSVDELLGLADVDAVFIASPDHWHATHLEAATKAGKHVYVEKPMAIDIGELNRAYAAAKASGVVIQVGTQLRSTPVAMGCRELVKSGTIGRLSRIEQTRNGERPYWYENLRPDVRAEDLDWNTFTKGRTTKPFDPILYSAWYGYWEFSQGPVPQWAVHFLDTAHFIAGLGIPETCVCLGGVYTWKDEHAFTAPDQVQALWEYPEGLMISYTTNFGNSAGDMIRYCGDKGTLKLGWENATFSAEGGIHRDGSIRGENKVEPIEQPDHWVNWYRCMRDGTTPNASLDAGYQHSIASIMATMSYEKGRRTRFDAANRTIALD